MPRIAVVDLSFHWPPTGGSWVDIAQVGHELALQGAEVRLFVPRLDTGGLKRGNLTEPPPVEVELVPLHMWQFNRALLPRLLASRVRSWNPDFVMLTNTFAMAPWLVPAFRDRSVILRIYGYEMLCPFYMSLWPHGKVAQWASTNPSAQICTRSYVTNPGICTWCAIRGMGRELLPPWMNPFSHEYVASGGMFPDYHRAARKALAGAYQVLVSNEFTERLLAPWAGKVKVVPGGVDVDRFRPLDSGVRGTQVLMPGRVEDPRKGYSVFRSMVHCLMERGCSIEARVTDPRYDGNSPHIASLGWVPYDAMPAVLHRARVVVVPTMWPEPFGLIALEAMSSGIPVVAHRIGGLPGLVRDGETGFLVRPGDGEALADRVASLVEDDGLWDRMSARARQHALSYSWRETVSRHYLGLFGMVSRSSS